ncbi:tetratricopeptide repeat protein [Herbidospora daliensis]|uniref:tetratricopeptide repeat protein n=1 Tax=Herbidospora daliensis TaxID=295585 RepID=UPI000783DBC5|nr:tetratricopeptide repeat protein [Herbidospora daliensis]
MKRGSEGMMAHEPYVGLRAFRAEDAHRFFGRDREAQEVAYHWQANRLTILHGPSGAGKTSLLQAGVLPIVRAESNDVLPVGRVSYRSAFPAAEGSIYPTAALPPHHNPHVFALLSAWAPGEALNRLAGLTLEGFLRSRLPRQDPFGDPVPVLLAVDQAEELFDGVAHRQLYREWFFDQLKRALDADENIRLLMCVRDEHLASILPHCPELVGDDHRRVRLGPLDAEQAGEAIEGPVRGTGRHFDDAAIGKLLRDLHTGDTPVREQWRFEPTRLQAACTMLWRSLSPGIRMIKENHVGEVAAGDKQVTSFCEAMAGEVAADHLNGDSGRLMVWLARTFVTQLVTRRRVTVRERTTAGMPHAVIDALNLRGVLHHDRAGWCELSHDGLIQPILQAAGPVDLASPGTDPDDLLGTADLAVRDRDFEQAKSIAAEALSQAAGDQRMSAEIHSFLGNIAHHEKQYDTAIDHYREAAMIFEALSALEAVGRLLVGIGRLRLAQGLPALAVDELTAALSRYPNDLSIKTALAWALWHDGAPDAARAAVTDVLEEDGSALDALHARGEILASMGEARAALHDFERATPLQWPSTKAAHALALVMTGQESVQEIDKEIAEALADAPDSGPVRLYAAWIESRLGHSGVARDHALLALNSTAPALPSHLSRQAEELTAPG